MRNNIKIGLYRLIPVALLAFFDNVIAKMTGNPLFPTPPVSTGDMSTLSDSFRTAIEEATNGSQAARKHRDNLVQEVRRVLRVTADYVRQACDGDAAKLALSGFPLAKQPEPINKIGVPGNVVASATDNTGNVLVRWSKTEGARMFRVERADSDPTMGTVTWHNVGQTARQRFTVTGQRPFEASWFRVIAIGIDQEGLPSDVVIGRAA